MQRFVEVGLQRSRSLSTKLQIPSLVLQRATASSNRTGSRRQTIILASKQSTNNKINLGKAVCAEGCFAVHYKLESHGALIQTFCNRRSVAGIDSNLGANVAEGLT